MFRFRTLVLLLLIAVLPLFGAQAQNIPPQLTLVLNALSTRLNRPLTVHDLDTWSYEQNVYTDSALGCPFIGGSSIPQGISGMAFTVVYQGVSYDYRVATDGSILFACEQQPEEAGLPTSTPIPTNCPADFSGYLPPRLSVGGQANIGTGGTPNRMRSLPSVNAEQIGLIQPGSTVSILDGPTCEEASHIVWWRVSDNGTVGWTAEGALPNNYFLAPLGGALPAERNLITIDNADTLTPLTTLSLSGVSSISFTADGTLVAFGGLSGLSVYNMSTLALNTHLSDPTTPVRHVAFSPDGRYLAYSTANNDLIVYDMTASARVTLNGIQKTAITALNFSPDTRHWLVSGSGDPTNAPGIISAWQVYDVPNGRQLLSLPTPTWVRNVAFSLDGTQFAWLDNMLHVVKVADGSQVRTLPLQSLPLAGLAWRPPSIGAAPTHSITYADGALIHLVNLDANTDQTYSGDPNFFAGALTFSRDGSLLVAMNIPNNTATASTVNIFDTDTSDLISSVPLQASNALVFSPDGTLLLVASGDEVVFLGASEAPPAVG